MEQSLSEKSSDTAVSRERTARLVLTRKVGEEVVIDGNIRVMLVAIKNNKVRLGFSAPVSVRIDRKEVFDRRLLNEPDQNESCHKLTVAGW